MKKRIQYLLSIFLIFCSVLSANQKLESVSLQLHWKYQFEFAGFIAAKEMGFYEDEGLDVEFKEYQFGLDIENEVLSGSSTYGIYNSNILKSYLQDKPLKLMASFFKKSAIVIITKPNIKNPHDLIGKTIMSATKEDFDLNFKYLFEKEKIDTNSINFIPHSFDVEDFIDSKCDAMTAFISDQTFKLDEKSIKYNIINPSDYGMYNLQLELFTSKKEAIEHPKRVKAFKRASIKGWAYALSHQDELIDIIMKKYNKNLSYEFLNNEAKKTELLILPNIYTIGHISKNFLKRQAELFRIEHNISKLHNIDDFIFNSKERGIDLTDQQKSYLEEKKVLKVCTNPDWAPIEFLQDDKPVGISIDTLNIVQKSLNIDIEYVKTTSWKQSQEFLKDKKCDILPSAIKTKKRTKYASFTDIYQSYNLAIITADDKAFVASLKSLRDKSMSRKQGSGLIQKLKTKYPNIKIVETKTHTETFQRVSDGSIYYSVASLPVITYYKSLLDLNNIQIAGYVNMKIHLSMAVQKDDLILLSILNKALSDIDLNTQDALYDKWTNLQVKYKINYKILYITAGIFFIILSIVIFFLVRERKLQIKVLNLNQTLEKRVKEEVEKNRKKEQQLIAQSRLVQMGETLSMIAHQWRQPLAAISAVCISLEVKTQLHKLDADLVEDSTQKIATYAQDLSATIDNFRNFFKADIVEFEISFNEVIDSALSIIGTSMKNRRITIVKELNSTETFKTFPSELNQVVLNLLKNAEEVLLKKKIENPTITIITNDNQLSICDNGGGIKTEILDRIFDPYFSTKLKKNGTGLGLYMSKSIIQEHCGGELNVSNSDEGAVFTIVLQKQ